MLWSIVWDVLGSIYEWNNIKTKEFPFFGKNCEFTDDTVLTVATAKAAMRNLPYDEVYRDFTLRYPHRWYGSHFLQWAKSDQGPYDSFGNGSGMRVGPIGWLYEGLEETLAEAARSSIVTHDHPEGVKGAQSVAGAIWMARNGKSKREIKDFVTDRYGYNLDRELSIIRPTYEYDVTCQGSVPEAIIAFLEADSFEDAIRNAISIGGDSDTIACVTGSIAEAFYPIPQNIREETLKYLPPEFLEIIEEFEGERR